MANLILKIPERGDQEDLKNYLHEVLVLNEKIVPNSLMDSQDNYEAWLEKVLFQSRGIDLPPDRVPATIYFLKEENSSQIIGVVEIRHELNNHLKQIGGNIGYSVRLSLRRKGYAKSMLNLALEKCRGLGLDQVLITCDKTNLGSAKTILANGGVLENEVLDEHGVLKLRFWIKL